MRKRGKFVDVDLPVEKADGAASALEGIIEDEQASTVKQALDAINPVCRELLILFYFEERNFKDIARILGFANSDVAKAKKYQCKKAFEVLYKNLAPEIERSL